MYFSDEKNTTRIMYRLRNICPGYINHTYNACSTLHFAELTERRRDGRDKTEYHSESYTGRVAELLYQNDEIKPNCLTAGL